MRNRTDANQKEIVQSLIKIGASVADLSQTGNGIPDICVGFRNKNYLFEIKDGKKPLSARQLTTAETNWHKEWRGKSHVIESLEQALEVIKGTQHANPMASAK